MSSCLQRVFQALLAAVLAFSCTPIAYAAELTDDGSEALIEESTDAEATSEDEEEEAESGDSAADDATASDDEAVGDDETADDATDDDATASDSSSTVEAVDLDSGGLGSTLSSMVVSEEEETQATGTMADVGYVYLDSTIVAVGEEQYVAIGLADESAVIDSAALTVTSPETGESMVVEASNMVDNAVLFTIVFDEDEATNYELSSFSYSLEGSSATYVIPLQFEDLDYAFDVVSAETAEALESSTLSSDGEDVTVITIDEDGTLEASDSVAESLAAGGASAILSTMSLDDYNGHIVIALDPGHGGSDGGASANGLVESELNWTIMTYCKAELETYEGVEVYVTKTEDETLLSLETRVNRAVAYGADVFISIHINAGGASGSEVYVPNDSSYLYELHTDGTELGESILEQLEDLGLKNRGVQTRDSSEYYYSDGSIADYYGVIRYARKAGMVGIIIEHAYIDNSSNAAFLSSESNLKKLGIADATGIAEYFGLVKSSSTSSDDEEIEISYRTHLQTYGWQAWKYDGATSGSTTLEKRLEAIQISIENSDLSGSITYRTHVQTYGWLDWVSDGETSGTTGQSKRIEAIQIKLTGELAEAYDVYYRVYVEDYGWLDWACNGETAGSSGLSLRAEAIEIVLVEKGGDAPGDTTKPYMDDSYEVTYSVHMQTYGWQTSYTDGDIAGIVDGSKRMEAFQVSLDSELAEEGSITYRAYVQTYGWLDWVSDGETAGTTGKSKRLEAIQIELTGDLAEEYDVYYRVYVEDYGWLDWACNGETAGSSGLSLRAEAIQIVLVEKGGSAPGDTDKPYVNDKYEVSYTVHVQSYGWMSSETDGDTAGTTGLSKRLEAIQIELTGELAEEYDVYYRVHVQTYGWLDWACNGETAGTTGLSKRIEAIEIVLVEKGGEAPGDTDTSYIAG